MRLTWEGFWHLQPLSYLLTQDRCRNPDNPLWAAPGSEEVSYEPISTAWAEAYVEVGIERAEWYANWEVQ